MTRASDILDRLEMFGIRMGLATTRPLLAALGDPQISVPTVLVAGTNGKGSTSALLASMSVAAGYRTGLYTSPHLEVVEERLRLDGRPVPEERLGALLALVVEAGERALDDPPTYFEALTAAAWLYFAEEKVDLAVMEVGMGGRLDATNAGEPLLSVITPIGLDHTQHLGSTLTAIAGEKAGILRPGVPALTWPGSDEAQAALCSAAEAGQTPLTVVPEAVGPIETLESEDPRRQRVRFELPSGRIALDLGLLGHHQAQNLALAASAAQALSELGFERITREAITRGTSACRWPGRLELIECPAPHEARRVLLDSAHNAAGVQTLLRFLDTWEPARSRPVDLLFGAFANKEVEPMLAPWRGRVRHVVLTAPSGRRPHEPSDLAQMVSDLEPRAIREPQRALEAALPGEGLLVVAGSLYLAGEARTLLRQRLGVPDGPGEPLFATGRPIATGLGS